MDNNDVLRRLRYIFDLEDTKIVKIFTLVDETVEQKTVTCWLKKEDSEQFKTCIDEQLASFLNGFIVLRRGKKEGPTPVPEKKLNNNIVFRKLKIALDYKSEDVLAVMKSVDLPLSEHELSAFFRKAGNRQYRECKDQVLRNFLDGLRLKHRP